MNDRVRNIILVAVVVIVSTLLLVLPSMFQSAYIHEATRVRGRVVETDDSDLQQFGIVKTGSQLLTIEIMDGDRRGELVEADNLLIGKMETDKVFRVGDVAYVVLDEEGGEIRFATAYDHFRLDIELILLLIFAAMLIAFSGWAGVRALLSFAFAMILVWRILLPGILVGQDPVILALIVVVLMSAATLFLVAGVNLIGLVALLGSALGILLTYLLSLILFPPFHLHGAIQPFSETLLYAGFADLPLVRIFLAAVFVGASGAVIDVAIDVAASMNEVITKRPDLQVWELMKSGFAVGRAMTSTMVTTLLMAYTSGYMALLMVFMAQGVPPLNILNTNYVAAEILKTVVGSMGLVTTAPFTALVGGLIYVRYAQRHLLKQQPEHESVSGVPEAVV